MSPGLRTWMELKTGDFADPSERRIALLPVAAVEQHGPHLPLGTDSYIVEAVIARLAGKIDGLDVVVLPTQTGGDSLEHADFSGTLAQRAETLIASWTALGHAAADAGLRRLAIVNSHGGQRQIVDIVAQRLRAERRLLVARINTFLLGVPEGLFARDELAFGWHGGEIETSMMLALAPDLVDMNAAETFFNLAARTARELPTLSADGDAGFAWQAQDLNPAGVTGNAAKADPARGHAMLDHIARRLAAALAELAAFPLSHLRDRPR